MTNPQKLIVGLGELLWDMLPGGPQLGGAVSNFSVMAARLGDHAVCASRLGDDALGRLARVRLSELPPDASFLQTDLHHPTGTVSVAIKDGQPEYIIHEPVAWDFLEFTPEWHALAERADAVCFGTLAQREPASCHTIDRFLAATSSRCVRIFDVNLREPFYSAEVVTRSLARTTVLKLNDAEMPIILKLLNLSMPRHLRPNTPEALTAGANAILGRYPVHIICITMGSSGSLLVTRGHLHRHHGIHIQVADTVGAGDAFTAALTHYYLRSAPLPVLNEAANRWGSWVASQRGAMPPLDRATQETLTAAIQAVSG